MPKELGPQINADGKEKKQKEIGVHLPARRRASANGSLGARLRATARAGWCLSAVSLFSVHGFHIVQRQRFEVEGVPDAAEGGHAGLDDIGHRVARGAQVLAGVELLGVCR